MWSVRSAGSVPCLLLWEWYPHDALSKHIKQQFHMEFPRGQAALKLVRIQKCSWRCGYYGAWSSMLRSKLIAVGNAPTEWERLDRPPDGWEELVWGILRARDSTGHRAERLGLVDLITASCGTGVFDFPQAHAILQAHQNLQVNPHARIKSG